jgi:hypothetical protein
MTTMKGNKNISVEVTYDLWKKLKIVSIQKETSLQEVVKGILERSIVNKKTDTTIYEEV